MTNKKDPLKPKLTRVDSTSSPSDELREKARELQEAEITIDEFCDYVLAEQDKAYRNGYNDNARDCNCDKYVITHQHLMDDGESYAIRPELEGRLGK